MLDEPLIAALPERAEHNLVANLLEEALKLLHRDSDTARRRIEDARLLVCRNGPADRGQRGVLANWQLDRAEAYVREHIDTRLRIDTVARVVNLSSSYFSRAFKATRGMSYSDYVMDERIALATRLLADTDLPIVEIALQCGLADQSHLTRVFSRAIGAPPRAWRCQQIAARRDAARLAAA
jgi:AraC-like DNA-binding protein